MNAQMIVFKQSSFKKQKGFSALELGVVIAVMATLIIMALRIVETTNSRARISDAVSQAQMIISAVNEWSPRSGIYSGVDINTLALEGFLVLPRDRNTGELVGTNEMNPWEGAITVGVGTHPTTYTITFDGIYPPAEAAQLASRLRQIGTGVTDDGSQVSVTIGDVD